MRFISDLEDHRSQKQAGQNSASQSEGAIIRSIRHAYMQLPCRGRVKHDSADVRTHNPLYLRWIYIIEQLFSEAHHVNMEIDITLVIGNRFIEDRSLSKPMPNAKVMTPGKKNRTYYFTPVPVPGRFYLLDFLSRFKAQRPPSPKSYPFIGSLLSIPSGPEHLAFVKLGKQLNPDIVSLSLFGTDYVVLNSAKAPMETLAKFSAIYSDQTFPPMMNDPKLMNWSKAVSASRYGEKSRQYRRMLNE
ncbi:hypothetical protein B0J17DRAFT_629960 [Rhizoctonia solani]|nr:hypothetical protein B0J17DRAFT_629960 [Rhizoctonia solani]